MRSMTNAPSSLSRGTNDAGRFCLTIDTHLFMPVPEVEKGPKAQRSPMEFRRTGGVCPLSAAGMFADSGCRGETAAGGPGEQGTVLCLKKFLILAYSFACQAGDSARRQPFPFQFPAQGDASALF